MQAYTGDTRAKKTLAKLRTRGIGRLIVRGRLRSVPDGPWVYDNGVFEDFKAGREWDARAEAEFLHDVLDIARLPKAKRPDWIALPDRIGTRASSYEHTWSLRTTAGVLHRLRETGLTSCGLRFAYVVQDGMSPNPKDGNVKIIESHLRDGVTTIFVGGSTDWKWQTAATWSRLAHSLGMTCHIGRAGSIKRVEQAAAAEADSIDSCLPLWSSEMLDRWLAALERTRTQLRLFGG